MDSLQTTNRAHRDNATGVPTSIDKAFDVCETLSLEPAGMSLSDLSRALKLPRPSVHRLLGVLKRRGYVRQDEVTQRYSLGVRTLDLSFRMLGRSELRMHAYTVLRDYSAQTGCDLFLAVPSTGEVTMVRRSAGGAVSMEADYGREMPAHCVMASAGSDKAQTCAVSCLRLADARDVSRGASSIRRPPAQEPGQSAQAGAACHIGCTCAPVYDYSGHEVARIGVSGEGMDDRSLAGVHGRGAWELARHVSMRLGYLSAVAMGVR